MRDYLVCAELCLVFALCCVDSRCQRLHLLVQYFRRCAWFGLVLWCSVFALRCVTLFGLRFALAVAFAFVFELVLPWLLHLLLCVLRLFFVATFVVAFDCVCMCVFACICFTLACLCLVLCVVPFPCNYLGMRLRSFDLARACAFAFASCYFAFAVLRCVAGKCLVLP